MPDADPEGPIRVMVVDDSAVIRGLFTRFLEADPAVSVVSTVSNGEVAVSSLKKHDIEIVVLDIEMPVMDGLTALPLLLEARPGIQVIMASTLTQKNAAVSMQALAGGAADYVTKPSSTGELHGAETFKRELTEKVKALGFARRKRKGFKALGGKSTRIRDRILAPIRGRETGARISLRPPPRGRPEVIAIGSSTGGPQALYKVFEKLGGDRDPPILVTQHMPPTFTKLLAQHIDKATEYSCKEADNGDVILPGRAYVAPGDYHMLVDPSGGGNVIRLVQTPQENYCRPSVDPMLRSLAKIYGPSLLVILLTGMGSDGKKGVENVTAAGGSVIAQDEETSVVWGMPGAVAAAGLCSAVLPLPEIAPYVRDLVMRTAA